MTRVRNGAHCHKMVAEVAKSMAGEVYEILQYDNQMRAATLAGSPELTEKQRVEAFIRKNWPTFIEQARATLAAMLGSPQYDESTKRQIHDALILDNSLRYGRKRRWAQAPVGASANNWESVRWQQTHRE